VDFTAPLRARAIPRNPFLLGEGAAPKHFFSSKFGLQAKIWRLLCITAKIDSKWCRRRIFYSKTLKNGLKQSQILLFYWQQMAPQANFLPKKTYKTGLKKNNHKFSYFIDSKWRRRRIFYSKTLKNGLKLFQKFQVCGRETGIFLPPLIESGRAAAPPAPPAATALFGGISI